MASFTAALELAVAAHRRPSLSPATRILTSAHPPKSISLSSSTRIPPPLELVSSRNGRAPVVVSGTKRLIGSLTKTDGLKFAIVVARFNEVVTNLLLEGALETFKRYDVDSDDITIVKVPGSFEIPVVAQRLGRSGKFDAVLCIGAVIRGDTTHYDAVANSAASGVLNAGLSSGIPCIFGVLTCDDMDQALKSSRW